MKRRRCDARCRYSISKRCRCSCGGLNHGRGGDEREAGVVIMVDGRPLPHVVYHSPTGMEWGYSGSGPADLALSILSDYLGERRAVRRYLRRGGWREHEEPISLQLHQAFKLAFVASWPRDGWRLTGREIADWLLINGIIVAPRPVVYEGTRIYENAPAEATAGAM